MSDDKQDTFAVVRVEEERTNMGIISRRHATKGRNDGNFFGYYHPDEIHTGPQALMDAVVGELGEQVALECLLVALEGCLEYRPAKVGEQVISKTLPCDELYIKKYDGDENNEHLVFTPPAPKDTLAERARRLAERMDDVGVEKGTTREIVDILGELAEKVEGGKE